MQNAILPVASASRDTRFFQHNAVDNVGDEQRAGNNRIQVLSFLNRYCALDSYLDSMLLTLPFEKRLSTASILSGPSGRALERRPLRPLRSDRRNPIIVISRSARVRTRAKQLREGTYRDGPFQSPEVRTPASFAKLARD